ncbi:hypothetical protein LY76DRAFT_141452 [Colletotrichum caudatum]|nr:hypothetical protein LY76DRAFT_141452 [Colletotrichum caudatum]
MRCADGRLEVLRIGPAPQRNVHQTAMYCKLQVHPYLPTYLPTWFPKPPPSTCSTAMLPRKGDEYLHSNRYLTCGSDVVY